MSETIVTHITPEEVSATELQARYAGQPLHNPGHDLNDPARFASYVAEARAEALDLARHLVGELNEYDALGLPADSRYDEKSAQVRGLGYDIGPDAAGQLCLYDADAQEPLGAAAPTTEPTLTAQPIENLANAFAVFAPATLTLRPRPDDDAAGFAVLRIPPRIPPGTPAMAVGGGRVVTGAILADMFQTPSGRATLVALFAGMTVDEHREAIILLIAYRQDQERQRRAVVGFARQGARVVEMVG
jgi:hypothetical protein